MPTQNFKVGEMLHKRTRNSKTWMNFDGSYTTEIHAGDVHFEDENGNLQNINTDLFDEADFDVIDDPVSVEGKAGFSQMKTEAQAAKRKNVMNRSNHGFQALRVPFDLKIPRNFKQGYTIGKGKDKMTFKPVKSSPSMGEPSPEDRSVIVYQDVWNDTDVELKVQPNGLKETLFLKTDRAPSSFSFEVKGKDIADDFTAGALKLMPAWLVDAKGTERDVEMVVNRQNDNKVYVDLVADVTGLIYPVEIDPTVIIDEEVEEGSFIGRFAEEWDPDSDFGAGTMMNARVGRENSGDYEGFLKFNLPTELLGAKIKSAHFQLNAGSRSGFDTIETDPRAIIEDYDPNSLTWNTKPDSIYSSSVGTLLIDYDSPSYQDYEIDITPYVQMFADGEPMYGIHFPTSQYSGSDDGFAHIGGSYDTVLTIAYNSPPTAPEVTVPDGDELWNALHTIYWNASTDLDGDLLVYQIQLSTDNGGSWRTIASQATGTSYDYNFTDEPETYTARIRIRAFDGSSYSVWGESYGIFMIQHNQAPDTPINLAPNGGTVKDRAQPVRLSWLHNDPNAGDPQSKFDLQWRLKGASAWNDVTEVTTNEFYDLTGLAHGEHEWRVRTYDQEGLSSPYSDIALFLAGDKPAAPTITNYSDGSTVAVANPTIQWSAFGEVAYKLAIKGSGGSVVWTSEQNSTNKAVVANANLENQTAYMIELSIRNADGLWSDAAVIGVNVSYTPPAKPVVTAEGKGTASTITVAVSNPSPVDTEPTVTHHSLYRRKAGDRTWTRISANIPVNGSYVDYTPASGQEYDYYVRAWGENGTYRDSNAARESVTLRSVWLHDPNDMASLYHFRYFEPGRTAERTVQGQLMEFEGREQPMAEFSQREQNRVNVVLQLKKESGDLEALHDLLSRRTTLLYRDAKGRRIFGVIFVLSENETDYGYTVPIEIQAVGYEEEV